MAGGTTEVQGRLQWRRVALLGGLALAVGWPALQGHPADGFPVSSYPMFASDRGRTVVLATAVGRTHDGDERRLGPQAIGGGDEVMLAAEAARLAVRAGPAEARRFCEEVAARLAGDAEWAALGVPPVVRDAVADPAAAEPPERVDVHARCDVG